MKIHPTAIVDPDAQLADSVEVQPYSVIGPQVRIGADTVIGPHCVIEGQTIIGERNRFFSGAQVGVLSQDLKHEEGLTGRARIGNDNIFREHISISASTMSSEEEDERVTTIGDSCLIMSCSHIAHDCHVGSHVVMANCVLLAGHVTVEDRAIIGGLVGVHQDSVVGTMAFVGGMTRVSKDAPPYMILEGNPARCAGLNSLGLRRNGLSDKTRQDIKKMYKIVWRSALNTTQALTEIEESIEQSAERDHFLQFFRNSVRGVVR